METTALIDLLGRGGDSRDQFNTDSPATSLIGLRLAALTDVMVAE